MNNADDNIYLPASPKKLKVTQSNKKFSTEHKSSDLFSGTSSNISISSNNTSNMEEMPTSYISPQFDIDIDIDINNNNNNIPIYKSSKFKKILVLSGGGVRGIAHIGAMQALEDLHYLDKFETFVGTSIGSLIASMYVIGYKPNELWYFIQNFDMNKLKSIDITNIFYKYGLDTGANIEVIIKNFIQAKGYDPKISLLELYNLTKKKLILSTTCLNTQSICYLSYENYPDLPLCIAIRMSISVPIYFTPVKYKNKIYVDGACIDNFPVHLFSDQLDNVLGIYLNDTNKLCSNIDNIENYILSLIGCLKKSVTNNYTNGLNKHIICINLKSIIAIDFNLSNDKKKEIYDTGYNQTISYIKKS